MGKHSKEKIIKNSYVIDEFENVNLDKTKRKYLKFDIVLFLCVIILSSFGTLVIYSATKFSLPANDSMFYFKKQLIFLAVSLFVFVAFLTFDYRKLKKIWIIIYLLNLVGLVSVLLFGYEVNSNKGWINLKFTSIQPSEFSKILIIICLAAVFSRWQTEKKSFVGFKKVILSVFIAFSTIILILIEPDFGQAIIYFLIYAGVLFISGANILYVSGLIVITIAGVFTGLKFNLIKQYQLDRLLVFLKPDVKPEGVGYNLYQSKLAIGSGKIFGKGLFLGPQTNLNYVPEHHTDFIFSVIGEELGFVGAFIVLILLGIIVWRCFYISRHASDNFGSMLAGGVGFIILSQMTINIGMTIGLMPIIGIPLPFLSYGGSNLLAIFIGIALVENVYMRRETRKDYEIAYEDYK
ncbi:MAG: rod shape-determining protein RodA [Actinobacteria bacterium]|nr:rod shape-determining protein RodA [Cyanobacteriota bacterium]MCL6088052.1 rod shape-determining protein RodA [Actinomycetota bacterium]